MLVTHVLFPKKNVVAYRDMMILQGKEAIKKAERATPPTKKTPPAKAGVSLTHVTSTEGRITPATLVEGGSATSAAGTDPKQEKKYREKLTIQVCMRSHYQC